MSAGPRLSRRACLARLGASAIAAGLGARPAQAQTQEHEPTQVQAAAGDGVTVLDESWRDEARQRSLPVRVRWPQRGARPAPVILFSHGLGGTVDAGTVWGEAWAAAGFVVIHLQHPGSDLPAVRAQATGFRDRAGLMRAATPAQLLARLKDVGFVLDELGRRVASREGAWAGVRAQRVGMSGHSFGAQTTLGMAGQRYPVFGHIDEPRLAAFAAFSPSLPAMGDARAAFAGLTRPMLCLTGTRDGDVVGNGATADRRAAVFDALPAGARAGLVLQDADHMTFGGQTGRAVEIIPREAITRDLQARHHALVAAISTDWWRWRLMDDGAARERLARPAGLAAGDEWRMG